MTLAERIHEIALAHGVKDMSPFAAKQIAAEIDARLAEQGLQAKHAEKVNSYVQQAAEPPVQPVGHGFAAHIAKQLKDALAGKKISLVEMIHESSSQLEMEMSSYSGTTALLSTQVYNVAAQVVVPEHALVDAKGHAHLIEWLSNDLAHSLAKELEKQKAILLTYPVLTTKKDLGSYGGQDLYVRVDAMAGHPCSGAGLSTKVSHEDDYGVHVPGKAFDWNPDHFFGQSKPVW